MAVKRLGWVLVLTAFAVVFVGSSGFSDKNTAARTNLRAKLKLLARQMTQVRTQLSSTKKKQQRISEQLHTTQIRLEANRTSLEQVRLRVEMTQRRIREVAARLKETEEKLAMHNKLLAKRLRVVYRHGPVSYVSVLLSSKSFSDYVDRKYYVSRVVNGDLSLITEIKRETQQVRQYKSTLEDKQKDLVTLEGQLGTKRRMIAQDIQDQQDLLGQVKSQREEYEQALNELEEDSRQIEGKIRSLQETPAGRVRAAQVFRGGFLRPVAGGVSSPFGFRFHPILHVNKLHTGEDLRAAYGTPIKAAAGGVVIHAGWFGAYGNAIIIDHGGRVSTLYGHCSSLSVCDGQSVKQGQIIGHVGSTGWSTGPHLHFEVRNNGTPVRPPF